MARRLPLRTVAVGLLALLASPAAAGASVNVAENNTTVTITAIAGTDSGNNRLLVRPHVSTDVGVEVRQLGFGDPTIRDVSHSQCSTDGLANAVTCTTRATAFDVTLGIGSETLEFGSAAAPPQACFATADGVSAQPVEVIGGLGGGDDRLLVVLTGACAPGLVPDLGFSDYAPRFTLDAGAGNDDIHAVGRNDVLIGGPGNDVIDAGAGDDQVSDSSGVNELRGGPGNDLFTGLGGRNTIAGNAGIDTVSYGGQSGGRVGVTIGDASNEDGIVGVNHDDVQSTVENVIGGGLPDAIIGSGSANELFGGDGGDLLEGRGGDDALHGGNGGDTVVGGDGVDRFDPGPGDDVVDARDAIAETVDCGPGTGDFATIDLRDTAVSLPVLGARLRIPTCESVSRFASDDGPPGRIATGALRVAGGAVTVRLTCPHAARVDCRGTLALTRATRSGARIARTSYAVARGRSAAVTLAVSAAKARALRGDGRAVLATRERGVSRKGPRSARRLVAVR